MERMQSVIRQATDADIPLIEAGLARLPNPPTMGEGDVERIIESSDFFFVDTVRNVFVWITPRPEPPEDCKDCEPDTIVVYWIWEGPTNPRLQTPVLGVACRAVKAAFPALGPQPIWGDFPGSGGTEAERKADSIKQAQEHESWMGDALTTGDSKNNDKMEEGRATLDAVIAGIAALEAG